MFYKLLNRGRHNPAHPTKKPHISAGPILNLPLKTYNIHIFDPMIHFNQLPPDFKSWTEFYLYFEASLKNQPDDHFRYMVHEKQITPDPLPRSSHQYDFRTDYIKARAFEEINNSIELRNVRILLKNRRAQF